MTYCPWLHYVDPPIIIIRSNSVEVRGRPWSHTMSKQPNVELPIVTAEHSLGKSTAEKRKRGRPKKQTDLGRSKYLPDMCAEHGLEKSSENTSVKRKQGRPKKQTYFGSSTHLPDMCAEHGIEKSSESTRVKRKRGRPKKQTEASLGGREGLSDMCDKLCRLGKSSDVERKRSRLGQVLTLP